MNNNSAKKEGRFLNALVYLIVIITIAMTAPLIIKFAGDYSNSRTAAPNNKEVVNEINSKNRKYAVSENTVDISWLESEEFDGLELELIKAKVADGGDALLFCSSQAEIPRKKIPAATAKQKQKQKQKLKLKRKQSLKTLRRNTKPC